MMLLRSLARRVAALFLRDRLESEMDREFKFHLEMRIQENIDAGVPEDEARRLAVRRFGSIELAKERGRDVLGPGILDPILQDLRYAVRVLRRNPGFTAAAVLALALGIGANTTVFSYMDAMFWRPLPLPHPERLVRMYGAAAGGDFDTFSYANYTDVRDRAAAFSGLAAHQTVTIDLAIGEEAQRAQAELVSGNYFDVLGLAPQVGRLLHSDDDQGLGAHPVAAISDTLWRRRFASDPGVAGKSIHLNGHAFTVIGVLPASFRGTFPTFATELWAPLAMHEEVRPRGLSLSNRGWGWLHGTGRLKPGVTREQAEAEVGAIAAQIAEQYPRSVDTGFHFQLLPATAMREEFAGTASRLLLFLTIAATSVLLIACGNIAGVLLARAMSRRGEIAIRQSLGASRGRLVRQWITESVLLAMLGGMAGTALSLWLTGAALKLAPRDFATFSPDLRLDWRTAGFAFAASLLAGLLFGWFPALWVRRADVASTLKHEGGSAAKAARSRLYGALVTVQISLSVVLLIAAGLLFRSLRQSDAFDAGFKTQSLVVAELDLKRAGYKIPAQVAFYSELMDRIRALPAVQGITFAAVVPLATERENIGVYIPGIVVPGGKPYVSIAGNMVGEDYFETMGIPMVSGRAFNAGDGLPDANRVAIIGEAMARQFWPAESPIGKMIRFDTRGPDVEIVGVARDIKYYDLRETPRPYIYRPFRQAAPDGPPALIIRAVSDTAVVIAALKTQLRAMNPNLSWDHALDFTELRREAFAPARVMLATATVFGVIALVITAIGLYGIISYSVSRRTSEIGVRMALGARRADVLRMVIGEGIQLALIGTGLGLLLAFGLTRYLSSQLFGVTATDPFTYIATTAVVFVVAIAACYLPARRATRIAPTLALKWGAS
jgi:macrolide transport system ATP-binding/permease protein